MKYAIISSRFGPTAQQLRAFKDFLKDCMPDADKFIIGGDAGDITIFDQLSSGRWNVEVYPHSSINTEFEFKGAVKVKESLPLRSRNKQMVDDSEIIVAIPQAMNENEDSPNWKTVRYAASNRKQVFVISPNGWVWELDNNRN